MIDEIFLGIAGAACSLYCVRCTVNVRVTNALLPGGGIGIGIGAARPHPESHYNPTFVPTTASRTMPFLRISILTALAAAICAAAHAQAVDDTPAAAPACAIAIVTGVGGAAPNLREYLAARERDRYRYLADHPLDCRVSEDGRASGCAGLAYLRRERVSVYDDGDDTMLDVVARIDLDHGTYPAIISVLKRDVRCEQ